MRVCAREKAKNGWSGWFLCRHNDVEYRKIRFEAISFAFKRVKYVFGVVISLGAKKWLRTA